LQVSRDDGDGDQKTIMWWATKKIGRPDRCVGSGEKDTLGEGPRKKRFTRTGGRPSRSASGLLPEGGVAIWHRWLPAQVGLGHYLGKKKRRPGGDKSISESKVSRDFHGSKKLVNSSYENCLRVGVHQWGEKGREGDPFDWKIATKSMLVL